MFLTILFASLFAIILFFIIFTAAIILTVIVYYFYCLYKNKYWKRRRIPGPKPNWLFGNSKDFALRHLYSHEYIKEIYDTYSDEPVVGLFILDIPTLFIRDLNIIEDVLVKNFKKFSDRGFITPTFLDPMSQNLFQLDYPTWKLLRKNISPVFSSMKIKQTIDRMGKCTDRFIEALNVAAEKNEPIEFCAFTGKFTTDILALSLFSIDSNTLTNEHSQFQRIVSCTPSKHVLPITFMQIIEFTYFEVVRDLKKIFRIYKENDGFLIKIIKNCMEIRKERGVKKNDFLDILMNLKYHPEKLNRKEICDDLLIAQAWLFTKAGNETMSLTISHALYELALNPHIQDKLRNEIAIVSDDNEGKLDYGAIKKAKYLDKVVKETLRKYPSESKLLRSVNSEHKFPTTNISLSRGCKVMIPIYAIHHDPKIYPEPEIFDPDRFDEEVAKLRPKMSYLPFGDGPRMCTGYRFAQNQIKLCLAIAIRNFKFETCEKTCKVYEKLISHQFLAPDGGLILSVKKI